MATDKTASFGDLLRHHRLATGLTQEELADRAGLSARAVQDLERGARRTPHPDTARRLTDALGLSVAERSVLDAARRHPPGSGVASHARSGLPVPLTSFVGRERELAQVTRLLEETRLLALTGVGGVGKTRLALQVAQGIRERTAGLDVALVELAALAEPARVPHATASTLGIPEQPGRPPLDALAEALRPQHLLLVLDNCEHLVDACADLADHLLRRCPDLRILTTSREPLGVPGEIAWSVPSLSVPRPETDRNLVAVADSEAARLFTLRAGSVLTGFSLTERSCSAVACLCRRLDGIPLALELAAARVSVLSVEQICDRLDNALALLTAGKRTAEARQQTLQATLDWSYGLLSDQEQRLFERLSVFASGCTLDAAEAVCTGGGIERDHVLELLARLVDKSLVVSLHGDEGPVRYGLLEILRQYAADKLDQDGDSDQIHAIRARWRGAVPWRLLRGSRPPRQGTGSQPRNRTRRARELVSGISGAARVRVRRFCAGAKLGGGR
jgi:predicted ATPase/DNA-binding XRE family transcriptional regulator